MVTLKILSTEPRYHAKNRSSRYIHITINFYLKVIMKLSIWMEVNNLQTCKVAKLFKVSPAHIYKYIHEDSIPRPKVMERIFLATHGVVTPNDFYGISTEVLEKKLLEQLKYKVIKT